jgi:AhpD family alkylhydroperoxidase
VSNRYQGSHSTPGKSEMRGSGLKPRIDYAKVAPGSVQAMRALETYVQQSGLERSLLHLIKTRASQINGCAFCLDMHTREAREDGETEERLYVLSAWRETADYTERERAALAWTEAVTRIAEGHVPDEVYEVALQQFTDKELADLTLAVVAINGWNRLSIAFRTLPATSREAGRDGHH